MRDFEAMEISLGPDLHVGEGSDASLDGAQTRAVVEEQWSDPADYSHMSFEEKLRLADVMIARWQRYRETVISEESIPHSSHQIRMSSSVSASSDVSCEDDRPASLR